MNGYVLVTAAYNEDSFIGQTISSIISQTIRPQKWIIVSDGSTDKTDSIVEQYAKENSFIHLHRVTEAHSRNFAAQVNAINCGLSRLSHTDYSFAGNIDADITLEPEYFALLLEKFRLDPKLGIGGGTVCERCPDGKFRPRKVKSSTAVPHACQLFRRDCLNSIGGFYLPLRHGGPDTHAEVSARMKGWRVASFADLSVYHHRPTNSAEGTLRGAFRQGKMDYSLGALPVFEILKLLRRAWVKPYLIGSITRCAGFINAYCLREERTVSSEFVTYLRQEQRQRIVDLFRPAWKNHISERDSPSPR